MTPERYQKLVEILSRRQPDLTVVMENVHKPHNLAAVARSCDAVGVGRVHGIAESEQIRLTQKSASGSARWLDVVAHPDVDAAYAGLRAQGFAIVAAHLSSRARNFRELDYTRPTALVVGAELIGVSEEAAEKADAHVVIPMLGMVQSLNVSVATALILFEAQRQRELAGLYRERRLDDATFDRLLFEYGYPRVARYYRRKGMPYPRLNERGEIAKDSAPQRLPR